MKNLVYITLLLLFVYSCSNQKNVPIQQQQQTNETIKFPDDWMGYWTGTLDIYKDNVKKQSIPMAIDHAYTDTPGRFEWAIIYGEDTIKGRRDYYLETVDAQKGYYRIDEQNGIYLDSYLNDNIMINQFEVVGNTISTNYTHHGNHIIFEVLAGSVEPISISGDTIIANDTIPLVRNFPLLGYQRAVLSKKK